jgi:hypothetical protein
LQTVNEHFSSDGFPEQSSVFMIRNGLYLLSTKALDGVEGGSNAVLELRDGTIRGGDAHFYFLGTYSCSEREMEGRNN